MPLQAVAFDYGMVLSGHPDPHAKQQMIAITGLSETEFEKFYWVDRHAYDRGDLSGIEFWRKFVSDAGLYLSAEKVAELNIWDARMWTTFNPEMIAWHKALKEKELQTAILSNMGDTVMESILATFAWTADFDILIWSYQHRMAKPEPEIYQLLLEKLGTAPEATLFLDDKLENIHAARQFGIQALQFSTVEQLRQDLISTGLDAILPLP